jgi:endonuclease-3
VEQNLEKIVPEEFRLHAHHWLILHGRYVCIARKPKCPECVVADLCRFKEKTPAEAPDAPAGTKKITSSATRRS